MPTIAPTPNGEIASDIRIVLSVLATSVFPSDYYTHDSINASHRRHGAPPWPRLAKVFEKRRMILVVEMKDLLVALCIFDTGHPFGAELLELFTHLLSLAMIYTFNDFGDHLHRSDCHWCILSEEFCTGIGAQPSTMSHQDDENRSQRSVSR